MSKPMATPKGVITIRPAAVHDAARLYDLRLEGLANHPEAFAADHDLTKAQGVEAWVDRIRQNQAGNEGVIIVAQAADQLIGMTGLYRGHWPKTQHSSLIWGVYVAATWRGYGIGQELLQACIGWGQAQGITIAKLGVATTNLAALRCYARAGFSVYGMEPQAIYYDGVFYDELLMGKAV
jgi:RimJ/RimL family protein N-acetyltransferase